MIGADEAEGGGFPHGLARIGAEDIGAAEDGGLPGEVAPQGPGAAGPVGVEGRDGVHVPVTGGLGARADGGQDQVPFADVDPLLLAVSAVEADGGDDLAPGGDEHLQVVHARVVAEDDTALPQPVGQRHDERLELVVAGEAQAGQVGEAGEVLEEAVHVALHLGQRLVLLEGEHRLEQRVEVRGEEVGVEPVLDGEPVRSLLLGHEELENGAPPLVVEAHLVGVPPPPAMVDDATGIDIGVVLVDGAELVEHGVGRRHLQSGDLAHDVPEALEVLAHLPSAAGDEAPFGVPSAVEGATGDRELLEDGDVAPGHAPVSDEEGGGEQGADARADEVGPALIDIGRWGGVVVGVQAEVVVDEGVAVGRDGAGPLAVAFGAGQGLLLEQPGTGRSGWIDCVRERRRGDGRPVRAPPL